MANADNTCKDLIVENLHSIALSEGKDIFGEILNLQSDTQKNVYDWDFENMSLRELMGFHHMNNHAIIDEIHEFTDSLGGVKDGDGSAIWKRWKKAYSKYDTMKFSDLSLEDQKECKFELIDILHFFMNQIASIGMTSEEVYNMYMAKNLENRNRQKNGY